MRRVSIGVVLLLVAVTAAVAAMGGVPWLESTGLLGEERLVFSRMRAYWDARVANDLEGVAQYQHPRQRVMSPGMLVTESYAISDLEVGEDVATAKVAIRTRLKHPRLSGHARERTLTTRWVRFTDGKWYQELKPETLTEAVQQERGQWPPAVTEGDDRVEDAAGASESADADRGGR